MTNITPQTPYRKSRTKATKPQKTAKTRNENSDRSLFGWPQPFENGQTETFSMYGVAGDDFLALRYKKKWTLEYISN